jgi:hypothetical protein
MLCARSPGFNLSFIAWPSSNSLRLLWQRSASARGWYQQPRPFNTRQMQSIAHRNAAEARDFRFGKRIAGSLAQSERALRKREARSNLVRFVTAKLRPPSFQSSAEAYNFWECPRRETTRNTRNLSRRGKSGRSVAHVVEPSRRSSTQRRNLERFGYLFLVSDSGESTKIEASCPLGTSSYLREKSANAAIAIPSANNIFGSGVFVAAELTSIW